MRILGRSDVYEILLAPHLLQHLSTIIKLGVMIGYPEIKCRGVGNA